MNSSELLSADVRPAVTVQTTGSVDSTDIAMTTRSIEQVMRRRRVDGPARIRLTGRPCIEESVVLAQVNLAGPDTVRRVQVAGPRGFIAALVADRFDRMITRLAERPGARVWPDPARPALAWATPVRPIMRHKDCELAFDTPAAATRTMDAMDYDAHLFVDAETGEDAVVHWGGPHGVRLARQYLTQPPRHTSVVPLAMDPYRARCLTESEAAAHLCRYGLPFLFFTDPRSKRGRLLLRRYDGDLTVVVPARGTDAPATSCPTRDSAEH